MNVNGIGTTGYPAWQGTRKAQQNAAGRSFAEQVNNVAGTPKVYNIFTDEDMLWTGGNGTGLSYYLKYAEDSTEDDPTIIAKGVDENGNEFEKTIHINEINPKSATVVEMRALEAHMGVKKLGGFTSLPMEARRVFGANRAVRGRAGVGPAATQEGNNIYGTKDRDRAPGTGGERLRLL